MNHKKTIQIVAGLAIGAFFLWWAFHGTDWKAVWEAMRHVNVGWLLLNQLVFWLSFFTRICRWSYIVRARDSVSFRHMFSATQIGFLANFVLPARLGEAIRALVLSRLGRIPFSRCLAMVALDRVTDLFGLIAAMLVAVFAFRPDHDIQLPAEIYPRPIPANLIREGALGMGLFLLVILGAFVMLYVNQRMVLRISDRLLNMVSPRLAKMMHGMIEQFAEGMHVFRSIKDMSKSIGFSLITWGLFAIGYHSVLLAFGGSWPWYSSFVALALVSVAITLPGPPGFIGPFHLAIIISVLLVSPETSASTAKAIAILSHLLNIVPIVTAGIFCLIWENMRVSELVQESSEGEPVNH